MKKLLYAGTAILLFISACSKSNVNPDKTGTTGKVKVGASYAAGAGVKVTFYQDTTFLTGYNKLYFVLADSTSGAAITNATLTVTTSMNMGMMSPMTSPIEQPVYTGSSEMYTGASVFNMATGNGNGQWAVSVTVTNPATDKHGTAMFMVNVNNSIYNLVTTQTGTDGQSYMIALVAPLKPQIGMNTLELLVDVQNMDMSYSPVSNFQVQFTPEMPAMQNMTSANNQNPAPTTDGYYVGKVNFSMTGDWKLDINLMNGGNTIVQDADIEFTF
jgi:hypothetical protein